MILYFFFPRYENNSLRDLFQLLLQLSVSSILRPLKAIEDNEMRRKHETEKRTFCSKWVKTCCGIDSSEKNQFDLRSHRCEKLSHMEMMGIIDLLDSFFRLLTRAMQGMPLILPNLFVCVERLQLLF